MTKTVYAQGCYQKENHHEKSNDFRAHFNFDRVSSFSFVSLSDQRHQGCQGCVRAKSGLYKGSHALIIGISDYTAGWLKLESVPYEMNKVDAALKKQGFHVVKVMNPASDELNAAFEDFIDTYGLDVGNRLLFFFSGHGHTRKQGKKGYLVPTDAPDPRYDEKGFARKAIGMNQILTWSREIEAKHALFLFGSCFSGTVFKAKALPRIPPNISDVTSRPVRQFISAGSAGEEVPAGSIFTPSFIRALQGDGDLDNDGYITGTEMGMYLHKKVLSYRKDQTPQYGKIKDPDLDELTLRQNTYQE
ncbi:MAG: caspase family protein [Deltaproteobacteria bacterium]|nr:caspase family protein [Deltaproteobacteria bacterium]